MIFWANLRRLVHIVNVVIRHAVAHAVGALLTRWPGRVLRLKRTRLSGPERLRVFFEELGGTFIKFGQMLALQPDILSFEYCNELFDLLDRCAPFEYEQVERIFVEETGKTPAEIFESFETQPLATASIGQVHIGYLSNRKVAIKVQRPSVETDFAGDIRLMLITLRAIRLLRLKFVYWLIEPISEFVSWTREELDYRCEARYMEKLGRHARNNLHERVPEVIWEYTTRRILVAEFFEGPTVLKYLRALENNDDLMLHRLKASGFDAHKVARHIIDNFLGDAFQHGIFHADLHPANLMILPGNCVGYVDFGITGVISRYSRQNLISLTLAYTRGDLEGMCEAFFKVSAIDNDSDPQKFRNGLKRLADGWYEVSDKRRRLRKNFTLVMLDMLRLSRAASIWPERDVIKYIRSSIAIDGLITRFAPGFDVGQHLEAVCHSYLRWQVRKSLFAYNTLVGWASSSEHLMRDGAFRFVGLLRRLANNELPVSGDISGESSAGHDLRRKTIGMIVLVVAGSLIVNVARERPPLAFDQVTTAVLIVVVATMMFWRTRRGLSASQ
ncbi:MAG TPA: AarF/UbiB family protein [Pyrinomonadaceae bacterium]|nr:AarF/UbiB family protein [Pyrinomonadaceae bacterium]